MTDWTTMLRDIDAREDFVERADTQPDYATAWRTCERGDWMLWLAQQRGVARTVLVRAACDCAALALPAWEAYAPDDRRPHEAIETARRWADGEATAEDVARAARAARAAFVATVHSPARIAAYAAACAACAAYADVSADVSDVSADSADSAADAAIAAFDAAYAANAAASAAFDAAYAAADTRALTHRQCADIVRHYIPEAP